jgi:hypothetical protein
MPVLLGGMLDANPLPIFRHWIKKQAGNYGHIFASHRRLGPSSGQKHEDFLPTINPE